ncbi:glycosyltransferase [Litoribacter alkaliphilus]|uniref:Glycosyltransferase n=1 Tax=Litoribacter ruber TaxID=702568 RepID=A0AAP2G5M8_9BACT|nr:glycosyltransferase [Litoribacter alkaliphilus]MBS9525695.1 glycosyltransferase [Litoribacter alkaliphilus]
MSRLIFHVPFSIDTKRFSASQIRPLKMIEAFKDIGYEVFLISGSQKERNLLLRELEGEINKGVKFDFFYSESSTMPQMLTDKSHIPTFPLLEYKIFRLVKKNSIPIGLFYRDMHWKFDQYRNETGFFKRSMAIFFYKLDLVFYNYFVDVIFLPSLLMKSYLPGYLHNKKIEALPPGHSIIYSEERTLSEPIKCMYVGGIKPPLYDLQMFSSFKYPLNIVCRIDEWEIMKDIYKWDENENINLYHSSGLELNNIYKNNDIFLLIWKPNLYLSFAMPMKIFEAIGNHIPIITNEGTLVSQFVKDNGIGWVIKSADELPVLLKEIKLTYSDKIKNLKSISKLHHWSNRAEKVKNCLKN